MTVNSGTPLPRVFNSIYNKPLKEYIIPYSDSNLKRVEFIANFLSVFFQDVVFYSHNNFEISVWVEAFDASDPRDMETLGAEKVEPLFLQSMALYQCANALGMDFIDFGRFRLRPGYTLQFPVTLPSRFQAGAGSETGCRNCRLGAISHAVPRSTQRGRCSRDTVLSAAQTA